MSRWTIRILIAAGEITDKHKAIAFVLWNQLVHCDDDDDDDDEIAYFTVRWKTRSLV